MNGIVGRIGLPAIALCGFSPAFAQDVEVDDGAVQRASWIEEARAEREAALEARRLEAEAARRAESGAARIRALAAEVSDFVRGSVDQATASVLEFLHDSLSLVSDTVVELTAQVKQNKLEQISGKIELEALGEQTARQGRELGALQDEVASLAVEVGAHGSALEILGGDLATFGSEVTDLGDELAQLKGKVDFEYHKSRAKDAEQDLAIGALQSELDLVGDEVSSWGTKIGRLAGLVAQNKGDLEFAKGEFQISYGKLLANDEAHDATLQALQEALGKVDAQLVGQGAAIAQTAKELSGTRAAVATLERRVDGIDDVIRKLEDKLAKLDAASAPPQPVLVSTMVTKDLRWQVIEVLPSAEGAVAGGLLPAVGFGHGWTQDEARAAIAEVGTLFHDPGVLCWSADDLASPDKPATLGGIPVQVCAVSPEPPPGFVPEAGMVLYDPGDFIVAVSKAVYGGGYASSGGTTVKGSKIDLNP
ncbi:MAG: hypothetical protein H6732_01800 [Alphaproteobacteria bacterium]|nr:hypothetical protein [Alphaproteobacteria bacterium]